MSGCGLTFPQANRLREDFKRGAHVGSIITERIKERPVVDELLRISIKLLLEEYDALFADFQGMLDGNKEKREVEKHGHESS
jgi:hypothetical protein